MLILETDDQVSSAHYGGFTDDILIADSTGPAQVEPYFDKPDRQRRRYSRYVRDDILATLAEKRLFSRKKFLPVRLIDVSQAGASISCEKKLKCGDRLALALTFEDGQTFEFGCLVVCRRPGENTLIYGLKFEKANHQYEEHLLKTGLKIKLNKNLSKI